jgi:hypothetical protein
MVTRRSRWLGDSILLTFMIVQVCDGLFTYVGVQTLGLSIEANPVVGWYLVTVGVGAGLIAMKTLAVGCAAILHRSAQHRILGVLTILYLGVAVAPWAWLLTSASP